MTWQPQQQGLDEVLHMLRNSQSSVSEVQKAVAGRLEELRHVPDFLAYLVHVLVFQQQEQEAHRAVAGLLLKNSLQETGSIRGETNEEKVALSYVRTSILGGFLDKEYMIRQTVGAVVVGLLGASPPGGWPEAMDALTKGMSSQDTGVAESIFFTLATVCEDYPDSLNFNVQGVNLLDHLVPEFIKFTAHSSSKVRLHSLGCLFLLSNNAFPAATANIDAYIRALFDRASDDNADVRRAVCTALGGMLRTRPDKLVPEMSNVVDYMAYCTRSEDEAVALEACEFWLTFAESSGLKDILRPYIGKVAPILLQGMVYSEYDLMFLDVDEEDEAVPDKETDIKPKTYSSKVHASHETNDPSSSTSVSKSRDAADKALEDDDDEDDDDYDDDDDDDEDDTAEWNIRKCSAAALDVMAVAYENDLLEVLLPHLKERMFSDEWEKRESGVLALGAIAEGCINSLEPHLPQLVPWLIGSLKDNKALIRSITCWTLGRYASWVVATAKQDKIKFFIPTMEGLLQMVLDGNKRVQEAGCSAFATLEEEAGTELVPFLDPILRNLTFAFNKYQQKNLLILYDALGTLADSVGAELGQPMHLDILMPPLIERWVKLQDQDQDLVPLLECLSSVSIAAGSAFAPYCQPVYNRCLTIIHSCLTQYQQFEANPDAVEEPDRTFIVVALDLLSGLTQGLGDQIAQLIQTSQPPLLHLMALCLAHYEAPIRQSAHALLGDIAISCFSLLKPIVPQIMPSVIEQISAQPDADCISVCNNAAWAVGEIALQFAGDSSILEPFVPVLMSRLVPILLNPKSPKSLSENAAVTIGRLGLVTPAIIAPDLGTFAQAWCVALWEIKDNPEKDSAFKGFCMMVGANPQGLETSFSYFCNAVCKWLTPSDHLDAMFRQILQGYKSGLGAGWDQTVNSLPPGIRERLSERYGV